MLFRCRVQVCSVTWCGTDPQLQPEQRAVCSRARQDHWYYHLVFRLDHSNQKSRRIMPENLAAGPKSTLRWRTQGSRSGHACRARPRRFGLPFYAACRVGSVIELCSLRGFHILTPTELAVWLGSSNGIVCC